VLRGRGIRSLGIDVGVRKGLDVVLLDDRLDLLDDRLELLSLHRHVELGSLGALIDDLRPDVVAIDAPPAWGTSGGSRRTEAALRALGIQSYGTPSDPRKADNPFYDWMRVGFKVFEIAASRHFHRYAGGDVLHAAIEVFPHASAVVLAGCLPPTGTGKREWRMGVLEKARVVGDRLRSADQVDAALAALTGLLAANGAFIAPGDPDEGVIVLPVRSLPEKAFGRPFPKALAESQAHLPGLNPCACGDPGCSGMTAREFTPGHDGKRKSLLWRLAREGERAAGELKERGWELPPEMR
jgi:predicted nuclease with RNAse H fold